MNVARSVDVPETMNIETPVPIESRTRGFFATIGRFLGRGDGDVARLLILLVIIAVIGAIAPSFLTQASWLALSQTTTLVALLALGQTFVIVTGGIDLSVGAVMACSAVVGASVMRSVHQGGAEPTVSILIGLIVMLCVGVVAGLVNGILITKLEITPFIVTLGMLSVATGTMNLISGGAEIVGLPSELGTLGNRPVGGWVPLPVIVTIGAAIIAGLVLRRTLFGLHSYAIGSNPGGARRAGVNVDAHLIRVYALSGLFAGIAGFLLTTRFVSASPMAGQGMELLSIAAAVIGGASLSGGRGSVFGTVIGALIMSSLQIGLIIAGVQSFWQTIAIGIITVAAVFGDQLRIKLAGERS